MWQSLTRQPPQHPGRDVRLLLARLLAVLALPVAVYLGNPALGLLAGATIVVAMDRKLIADGDVVGKYCLQAAIVLLGLGLDLGTLFSLSATYSWLVGGYVIATLAAGLWLGHRLAVDSASTRLIASGTAICGGTAIATLSRVVQARAPQTAVALAIVFLLNAVALFCFPLVGRWLVLSQLQFGLWSALAIHDTSSVVATAAIYGEEALEVATTIKLGRTLWLIPLAFFFALHEQARIRAATGRASGNIPAPSLRVPAFILLFIAAAGVNSTLSLPTLVSSLADRASRALLVVALFLVGAELCRTTLRRIRGRELWLGCGLWLLAAPASLALVMHMT